MQSWDESWNNIYQTQSRDKYPSENVIRFMARNYYRVKDRKSIKVLDLGCGTGNNLWYLVREGFSAYGIDGSSVAVAKARERLKSEGVEADLVVADLISIPFPEEYFDAAIDRQSTQHNSWNNVKRIISEVHRVLRGGGKFLSLMVSTNSDEYQHRNAYGGVEIEKHTLTDLKDCTFEGAGIVHFFDEEEIRILMKPFKSCDIGYEERLENGILFAQWIVITEK